MLKAKDFRNESIEELDAKVKAKRKEIYDLRSAKLDSKTKNTHLIGHLRKEIARILTVKKEKGVKA